MLELVPENLVNSELHYGIPNENAMFTMPGILPFRAFEKVNVENFAYTINHYLKKYDKNIIYFADYPETFEPRFINFINAVGSKLIALYHIPKENVRYACGAWPIQENIELYKHHCIENNWLMAPVTLTNYFEHNMAGHILENNFSIPNQTSHRRSKIFTCFNGGARFHRVYMMTYLHSNNLLNKSYFSMHCNTQILNYIDANIDVYSPWYKNYRRYIKTFLESKPTLPMILTIQPNDFKGQHTISPEDIKLISDSYFSVINETSYFKKDLLLDNDKYQGHLDSIFLTEKTFRTIACQHPFIIASRPHTLKHMRRVGYKTFGHIIDESYDDIENDYERLDKICSIIKELCHKKDTFWKNFVEDVKPICLHNYELLKSRKYYHISDAY